MKITTWNVNSVNARIEHLVKFIKQDQSDIYMIQELKCTNNTFPIDQIKRLNYYCSINGQKAWNGVAIISKNKVNVSNNSIPNYKDLNARFIEAEILLKNIKKNKSHYPSIKNCLNSSYIVKFAKKSNKLNKIIKL